MLDINQLSVFIRVVDEGSFTAAGKALNIPKSRISRMVADLESTLGVRLLQRSTRQVSLTQVGADYYNNCKHLVAEVMDVHAEISDRQDRPHGVLRIAVPMVVGSGILGRFVAQFQQVYPDVRVELCHTDRQVNLIEEKFDLALLVGELPESSLIARTVAETDLMLCASPEYIQRNGTPSSIEELQNMDLVKIGEGMQDESFEMTHMSGTVSTVKLKPNIVTNHIAAAMSSIIHGAGVGVLPMFMASEYLLSGRMVSIMNDWSFRPQSLSVVYPSRQYLSLKVRCFIDFLVAEIEELKLSLDTLPKNENEKVLLAYKKLIEH
ncbi:MAG TPA: LysR family transcriptional regulator [Oceanospirillales bacterium]|mgnify:CR=1 FL=1|nr:LysR family transcriptional regulator [Oceanospirillales bacterium]|tara:strand:- start:475 stop:1440 length:966 start_codon:yes stop_codon:yes gene_type:complete